MHEQLGFSLNDVGFFCYAHSGQFNKAQKVMEEATTTWRSLDNQPMLANNLTSLGTLCIYMGAYDQAERHVAEAYRISQNINNIWGQSFSQYKIGLVYRDRGEISKAIKTMENSIQLSIQANFTFPQTSTRMELALLYAEMGAFNKAMELAELAAASAKLQAAQPYILGTYSQVNLCMGRYDKAQALVNDCSELPDKDAWGVYFIPMRFSKGALLLQQG